MSETIVHGLGAVAFHFKKSVRQIRNWRSEGMPLLSGDRYDLMQIEAWRTRKKGGRGPAAPDGRQLGLVAENDKDFWDKEGKRYQAELRKLEYRQRLGELIEVMELEVLLAPRAQAYRQGLISFEQILVPRLVTALGLPPESTRILTVVVREVAREVLGNVLRDLTLPAGQVLRWEGAAPRPGDDE